MEGAGWSRVTHPFATVFPAEAGLTVRLACVRHAASVHPEPGSNSPSKGAPRGPFGTDPCDPDPLSTKKMKISNVRLARTRSHPGVRGAEEAPRSFRMISAVSGSQGPRPPPSGGRAAPRFVRGARRYITHLPPMCQQLFYDFGKIFSPDPSGGARERASSPPQ